MVGRLGPGDYFGEKALLASEPRTATITSESFAECLKIQRQVSYRFASQFDSSLLYCCNMLQSFPLLCFGIVFFLMLPSKWTSDSDPISPPKDWSETVSMFSNIRDTIIIYINLISSIFVILHLCFSNLKRYGCLTGASTLKSWASKKSSPSQIAKLRVSWHRRRIHWVRFTYGQRPCKRYAIYLYYAYWGLPK